MTQPLKTQPDSSRLGPLLFGISVAASLGLIAVGVFFIFDNADAAKLFGVPLSGRSSDAYLNAAAVRDIAFGALTLVFALVRDRRAVGLCVLLGAIIPIGDGLIVMGNSATPLEFLPLHWGGAVACFVFAFIMLRPLHGNSSSRSGE
jgi:hypothetical protein